MKYTSICKYIYCNTELSNYRCLKYNGDIHTWLCHHFVMFSTQFTSVIFNDTRHDFVANARRMLPTRRCHVYFPARPQAILQDRTNNLTQIHIVYIRHGIHTSIWHAKVTEGIPTLSTLFRCRQNRMPENYRILSVFASAPGSRMLNNTIADTNTHFIQQCATVVVHSYVYVVVVLI